MFILNINQKAANVQSPQNSYMYFLIMDAEGWDIVCDTDKLSKENSVHSTLVNSKFRAPKLYFDISVVWAILCCYINDDFDRHIRLS